MVGNGRGALVDEEGEAVVRVLVENAVIRIVNRGAQIVVVTEFAQVVVDSGDVLDEKIGHGGAEVFDAGTCRAFIAAEMARVGESKSMAPVNLRLDKVFEKHFAGEAVEIPAGLGVPREVFHEEGKNRFEADTETLLAGGFESLGPDDAACIPNQETLIVGVNGFDDGSKVVGKEALVFGMREGEEQCRGFRIQGVDMSLKRDYFEAERGGALWGF